MKTPNPWREAVPLLQAEYDGYKELLMLLRREATILRSMSSQSLLELTQQKEVLLGRIREWEEKRTAYLQGFQYSNSHEEGLNWVVKSTDPQAKPVQAIIAKLVQLVRAVRRQSELNTGLVHRGLQVVGEALQLVQEGFGVKPVYGESGKLTLIGGSGTLNLEG